MTVDQRERRITILETEVSLDFGGLVEALKSGLKVVLVTAEELAPDLDPESLRIIGGMVMLCDHYGASVIFTKRNRFGEVRDEASARG
ncbi:MAG: hypothetical protein ACLGXA_12490 [Acidobacteriota bacterium]